MTGFAATGVLTRLALRRDRIQIPVWWLGLVFVLATSASSVRELYADETERQTQAAAKASAVAARMISAPPTGTDLGALMVGDSFIFLAVLVAFMTTLMVVRHTRQNEELGRAEMTGSMVVGRYAHLTAALIVAVLANLVLSLLLTLLMVALGRDFVGSLAAGLAIGSIGLAFAGIAAIAAQIPGSSRGANGMCAGAIGAAFLLRAVGDALGTLDPGGTSVTSAWPSWLSPIGWAQQVEPYTADRWWVLVLPVLLFAGSVAVAAALLERRDVGAGLLQVRPGPTSASPALLSPLGLAWRLQRGSLLAWTVGLVVLGAVLGSVGQEANDALADNPDLAETIANLGGGGGNLTDSYYAAMMSVVGAIVAGYTVQTLLRMRSEEALGPLEPVLGAAVSRPRWMASHVIVAMLGTVVILVCTGLAAGVTYGLASGDLLDGVGSLLGATLVQVPAALALAGFVVGVFGLVPRLTVALAWAGFAFCVMLGQLGKLLQLPQSVLNISPFSHTPAVPAVDPDATPIVILLLIAVVLTAAGIMLFRRRDLALPS